MRGAGDLTPILGCAGLGVAGLDYCYNASAVNEEADREDFGNATIALPTNITVPTNNVTFTPAAPTTAAAPEEDEDFSSSDQASLSTTDIPCSAISPCDECIGDCQSADSNCEGTLECFVRPENDITIVPGCPGTGTAGTDYCWHPVANTLTIRTTDCSNQSPCQECEGGCSNDDDCALGLVCFRRQDLSVVPGCGNGFRAVNFCYDPAQFGGRHLLRH